MGLSRKRKQQLRRITSRSLEIRKQRKTDREAQQKEFLIRQREGDENGNLGSKHTPDDPNYDKSSQNEPSHEEDLVVENKRRDSTCEGLGNNNGGVQLRAEERAFKPTWRQDAGGYLRGVRGCGSSATVKRERRQKRALETSASQTRSILGMFAAQVNTSNSDNAIPMPGSLSASPAPENLSEERVEKGET